MEVVMIIVHAHIEVKSGNEAAFASAAKKCVEETRKENGNIAYSLHASVINGAKFIIVEKWESRENLIAHTKTDHYIEYKKATADLLEKPTIVEVFNAEEYK